MGQWVDRYEGPEYVGFEWVCYDNKFTVELDGALEWMPLPEAVAES
jgi:hypothetical protein